MLYVISRQEKRHLVKEVLPHLISYPELCLSDPKPNKLFSSDAFFITLYSVSIKNNLTLIDQEMKVIDLSADFCMQDTILWEQCYKQLHEATSYVKQAEYMVWQN